MVISILDYSTNGVTILQNVPDNLDGDTLQKYLKDRDFDVSEISYIVSDVLNLSIR